jgi:hypothetical protein
LYLKITKLVSVSIYITLIFSSRAKDLARSSRAFSSIEVGAVVLVMVIGAMAPAKETFNKSAMKRPTTSTAVFSEENRERFYRVSEFARKVVHDGWIPLIMLIGTACINDTNF